MTGKHVLIIGASGGLGVAFARKFAAIGAFVSITARNPENIRALATEINTANSFSLDLESAGSIQTLVAQIEKTIPALSVVINATGYDVRKSIETHTLAEIDRSLAVNLRGSILLTQAFLPILKRNRGIIVHMGGFADGRLAFPYYAADAASRSGLRGFIDSVNREIADSGAVVSYFSPSPADTEAERPFHPLWRQMGIKVEPVEKVASALLKAVEQRKKVAIMGGWLTVTFARLNAAFPALADLLMTNNYTKKMHAFFGEQEQPVKRQSTNKPLQLIGILLIVASFVLYGIGLFIIPFTALDTAPKAGLVGVALGSGELTFWIGAAIVGSSAVQRYRKYLNPCNWFSSTKTS